MDGHFIQANFKKEAIYSWNKFPKSWDVVSQWVESGKGLAAVVPSSLGLAVIDVDKGGQQGVEYIIDQLGLEGSFCVVKSKKGHHIWVKVDGPFNRYAFKLENGVSGDFLGANCYAVIHCDLNIWKQSIEQLIEDGSELSMQKIAEKIKPKHVNDRQEGGFEHDPILRLTNAEKGTRNNTLYGCARDMDVANLDPWLLTDICAQKHPDMATKKVRATILSALKKNRQEYGTDNKYLTAAGAAQELLDANVEHEATDFAYTDEGFMLAIDKLGYDFRHDLLSSTYQFFDGSRWMPLTDEMEANIHCQLAKEFTYTNSAGEVRPYDLSDARWTRFLRSSMQDRSVNAFEEDFLKTKPEWDKIERIEEAFIDCLGAEDTPLNRQMSKLLFLAIVARNYENFFWGSGVQFDYMPILQGREGNGKSTFCREICGKQYHDDGLNIADSAQKQAESIDSNIIIEVSELSGLRRAEIESYKALITRTTEPSIRRAYQRHPRKNPRYCVFIGTSNPSEVIPDTGGENRRWVVVNVPDECTSKKVSGYFSKNRDQLFAEAIHVWRTHKPDLVLDSVAENLQTESNREHLTGSDDYRELIGHITSRLANEFQLTELVKLLLKSTEEQFPSDHSIDSYIKTNSLRLRNALHFNGYRKKRVRKYGIQMVVWSNQ